MNNGMKLIVAGILALTCVLGADQVIAAPQVTAAPQIQPIPMQQIHPEAMQIQPGTMPQADYVVSDCVSCGTPAPAMDCGCDACAQPKRRCGCLKANCRTCRLNRGTTQCPACDEDICRLELDKGEVEKTCFKVEQKTICVPPVRLPWMKDCPPGTSKTKVVNTLKKHKYKCPKCSYKWKLEEAGGASEPPVAEKSTESTGVNVHLGDIQPPRPPQQQPIIRPISAQAPWRANQVVDPSLPVHGGYVRNRN